MQMEVASHCGRIQYADWNRVEAQLDTQSGPLLLPSPLLFPENEHNIYKDLINQIQYESQELLNRKNKNEKFN